MFTDLPRIGFNMWPYTTTQTGGMAYYALSLLRELSGLIPKRIVVFFSKEGKVLLKKAGDFSGVQRVEINDPGDIYDHRELFDVLFCPYHWGGVNMLDYPFVHVIPDIQEQYYPEFFSEDELTARNFWYPYSALASTLLITISEFSKKTIVEKFGLLSDKIRVTYPGAHPIFSEKNILGSRPEALPAGLRGFLFYPSHSWFHKNHKAILDAVLILKNHFRMKLSVVFSGHLFQGQFNNFDIPAAIAARGLEEQVFHIGNVSLSELKYLYLNAVALVHPSLFEGFGIPLVEAMSCGCPMVVSDRTSLPEIGGKAALYFNPEDPLEIAQKIKHVFENQAETVERVELGRLLAKNYSDRRTAEQTLKILEETYQSAGKSPLKRRAFSRPDSTFLPLVTAAFFVGDSLNPETIEKIRTLKLECGSLIQVIIASVPSKTLPAKGFVKKSVGSVVVGGNFAECLRKSCELIKGEYLFVSTGAAVLLSSIVYHIASSADGETPPVRMLEGHFYKEVNEARQIRDGVDPQVENEELRQHLAITNFSFLIQSQFALDAAKNQDYNFESLDDFVRQVWFLGPRHRLFRTVNTVLLENQSMNYNSTAEILIKVNDISGKNSWIARTLGSRLGGKILRFAFRMYHAAPRKYQ
jgi:glycosyltransferase involved in cell wall biosynthesis